MVQPHSVPWSDSSTSTTALAPQYGHCVEAREVVVRALAAAAAEQAGRVVGEEAVGHRPAVGVGHQTTPSARSAARSSGVDAEVGQHRVGVGAEDGRAGRHRDRLADEPRVGRLLADGADHGIVDRHQVAAGRELGVGEHVGGGERGRDRDVVRHARGLDLGRRSRRGPLGDDPVDLVVVRGAVDEPGEPRDRPAGRAGPSPRRGARSSRPSRRRCTRTCRRRWGSCRAGRCWRAGCPRVTARCPSRSYAAIVHSRMRSAAP